MNTSSRVWQLLAALCAITLAVLPGTQEYDAVERTLVACWKNIDKNNSELSNSVSSAIDTFSTLKSEYGRLTASVQNAKQTIEVLEKKLEDTHLQTKQVGATQASLAAAEETARQQAPKINDQQKEISDLQSANAKLRAIVAQYGQLSTV